MNKMDLVECQPGDSTEQRDAELELVAAFASQIDQHLAPKCFAITSTVRVEVDAASVDGHIIFEAWAHIGIPKSAQKNKVMTDAMKLQLVEMHLGQPCRKVLLFADRAAAKRFQGANWMAEALRRLEVEVVVVEISDQLRTKVAAAQARQYR